MDKGQLDNTLPPFMEQKPEKFDVEKNIRTTEDDWAHLKIVAAHVKGAMGDALHELLRFYMKYHRAEEEKAATSYDGIAGGFYEEKGEKAGLKI